MHWTNLSNNQLSHSVVSAEVMQVLIAHVQQVLEWDYPDYELAVSQVHDYYNLPISTFECKDKTLVIHISFYIKPRNQEPLFLYDIRKIPVPYHMNEELIDESESKYTLYQSQTYNKNIGNGEQHSNQSGL